MKDDKQIAEYLEMGFKLMPSGRINHHLWYGRKFGLSSAKDSTWRSSVGKKAGKCSKGYHVCCGSKKAYCHNMGCKNRVPLEELPDDLSDLKDITNG